MRFHAAGKVALEHLYTAADPRTYFGTLRELDYQIPQLAKPHFTRLLDRVRPGTVVDIGCSYGVNAALLRCGRTMEQLYAHYAEFSDDATRDDVLARDRALPKSARPRFVGLDISADAVAYGLAAGFLDDAVLADLEQHELTERQRDQLAPAELVISTGCVGYISERTLTRVVQAAHRPPWMAHTVLRMYRYEPIMASLAELGYQTVAVGELLQQRRFASAEEQAQVLDTLADLGVDPQGLETEGWLYARMYVSTPKIG